ncbi:hypothetical protein [Micromonospora sp. KC721]|uniref:hypothetical protein n=1 Tax=Micromonospora sp. KC721 TaxID=2530380 RepID=UPI0010489721|nr:hypothetical protein [Micromonospora sp. KC721]TDB80230.1 hypothetical protein E1182_09845 [Micromonospora sp. KC721]
MHQRLTALLALPLLALPACTTPTASAAPQPPASTPVPDQSYYWPGQDEVMDTADRIESAAAHGWPRSWAGVENDLPGRSVVVHRIPTPGMDAEIRAMVPPGVGLRFVDAVYSAQTLDAWLTRVRADQTWWERRHGVLIHSTYAEMGECAVLETEHPARDEARIAAVASRSPGYRSMSLCVRQGYPYEPLTPPTYRD